jgi:hypothetical protein
MYIGGICRLFLNRKKIPNLNNKHFSLVYKLKYYVSATMAEILKCYEELEYDAVDLQTTHQRIKRSLGDKTLKFKFNAFKK